MNTQPTILSITLKLLFFFVPEILIWIFIKKWKNHFSFRFGKAKGYSNLNPFISTWIAAVVIFVVTLFSQDIFEFLFGKGINSILGLLGNNLGFLTLSLAGFAFLWVYNYLLEKEWDKISWWITIPSVILFLIFVLPVLSSLF